MTFFILVIFVRLSKVISYKQYRGTRVVCPIFGHPALTSSFTKYNIIQVKNNFLTILNGPSVLKLFQLSNGDFFICVACLQHLQIVRKPRMTKLGQGVEVRAHYPTSIRKSFSIWRSWLVEETRQVLTEAPKKWPGH